MSVGDVECLRCRDTGCVIADGEPTDDWCDCDARPFGNDEPSPQPAPGEAKPLAYPDPVETEQQRLTGAELMLAVDAALLWSTETISWLVGMSQWRTFLDYGGDPAIVARNMLERCVRIDPLIDELPGLVERIRATATATMEKAGS